MLVALRLGGWNNASNSKSNVRRHLIGGTGRRTILHRNALREPGCDPLGSSA